MNEINVVWLAVALTFISLSKVTGLECYVCLEQEDNDQKCINTIAICDYNQDVCLTEVKWGSTRYWDQDARKQYYISKRCSNKTECTSLRQSKMPFCTYIWYLDWSCIDCCQGDRCNYYIINGSQYHRPLLSLLFAAAIILRL